MEYKQEYNKLLPSFEQIIQEIGEQLRFRKNLLFRRIFLIIWPGIIAALLIGGSLILIIRKVLEPKINPNQIPWLWPLFAFLGIWILFTALYYLATSWIFGVEKRIWVISYFDKRNLDQKESWKIAKKLALPVLKFKTKIFLRFYFPSLLAFILLIAIPFIIAVFSSTSAYLLEKILPFAIGFWIIILILIAIYYYFLRIKLRFLWFLFLDSYGKEVSFSELLEINKQLNEIKKRESFKKALEINLGETSLDAIIQVAIGRLEKGLAHLGEKGRAVGLVTRVIGEESSKQLINFGKIIAIAMLYRSAWSILHEKPYKGNELLYATKENSYN